MNAPSDLYIELDVALTVSGIPSSSAEVHGAITGILCANPMASPEQGMMVLQDPSKTLSQPCIALLNKIFMTTAKALKDDQFRFHLLLPDDDTSLDSRAEALAAWCRGFLYGFGLMGERPLSMQAREILHDFTEIGRLDPSVKGEEEEGAYVELVEFVRVGAQLLSAESLLALEKEKYDG